MSPAVGRTAGRQGAPPLFGISALRVGLDDGLGDAAAVAHRVAVLARPIRIAVVSSRLARVGFWQITV